MMVEMGVRSRSVATDSAVPESVAKEGPLEQQPRPASCPLDWVGGDFPNGPAVAF